MQTAAAAQITIPEIGAIWPGQGGIYAGFVPARGNAEGYHLILGDELGRFEWGQYGDESPTTSLIDGRANTLALIESGGNYPAAIAAHRHEADGHTDFYLPAAAELYEVWLNLNGKISGWAWSSSQRSADIAFFMPFGVGTQSALRRQAQRAPCPPRPQIHFLIHLLLSSRRFPGPRKAVMPEAAEAALGACKISLNWTATRRIGSHVNAQIPAQPRWPRWLVT